MDLVEQLIEMNDAELREYVEQKSEEMGIEFDFDMLDERNRFGLFDFIADNIHPELQGELHSECQLTPGRCAMFPNAETEEDIEEEMEHYN